MRITNLEVDATSTTLGPRLDGIRVSGIIVGRTENVRASIGNQVENNNLRPFKQNTYGTMLCLPRRYEDCMVST
jgi:hypothetical protein